MLIQRIQYVQSGALNALVNAQAVQDSLRTTGIYPLDPSSITSKLREGHISNDRKRGFHLDSNILSDNSFQQSRRRYLHLPIDDQTEEVEPTSSISISSQIDEADRELDIFQVNLRKRLQFPFGTDSNFDHSDHHIPIAGSDSQLILPREPVSPPPLAQVRVKEEMIRDDSDNEDSIGPIQPQKRESLTSMDDENEKKNTDQFSSSEEVSSHLHEQPHRLQSE
ncbi:hypothetical protein BLNAU_14823 [Blattamonas nauphoetae]|uniref:Uncharacterized protein n=1 Tax=Blattamonas nauphoetae TaxID=2049346 RepID=A0ABQ9XEX1_9EUKA|nr:hypothetical protein BLNAU_14823 [Blattamonas nauphoetae]